MSSDRFKQKLCNNAKSEETMLSESNYAFRFLVRYPIMDVPENKLLRMENVT